MRIGLWCPDGPPDAWAAAAERHGLFGVATGGAAGAETCVAGRLAATTSAVRLVVRLAIGSEHPLTLAEEVNVVDNLSNGRVVVVAEPTGLDDAAVAEDVGLLRLAMSSRPVRHVGSRWRIPAGLPEHQAPPAVIVTPPPAQVEVPCWMAPGGPSLGPWVPVVADAPGALDGDAPPWSVRPGRAVLSGRLADDVELVRRWADAGASHLLVEPPTDWTPDDLAVVSRHLVPEVGMVGFPSVVAAAPAPRPWPSAVEPR